MFGNALYAYAVAQQLRREEELQDFREPHGGLSLVGAYLLIENLSK